MIESKNRKSYFYKALFLFVAVNLIIGAIILSGSSISKYVAWLIAFCVTSIIAVLYFLTEKETRQRKVAIENGKIFIYNLFAVKAITLNISELLSFETTRQKLYTKSGVPINNGFRVTRFLLTQNRTFIISEDQYENYSELVNSIVSKMHRA
jgi:hypothetical protein